MKKIFIALVLIVAFLVPTRVGATDLKLTYDNDFKQEINENFSIKVLPSYDDKGNIDGNLFFYYDSNIASRKITSAPSYYGSGVFKLDLNNNLVYTKGYRELFFTEVDISNTDADNGTADILITGYDESGEVVFETRYGGSGDEDSGIVLNSFNDKGVHDGYLIGLTSFSSDLKVDPGYILIKIDLKGNLVWEKNINEYMALERLIYVVDKKIDSGFRYDSNGSIFRINVDGDRVWQKDSGIEIASFNYSYNSSGVIDGIVVVGVTKDGYKGVIIKYDLSGNEIFRHLYDSTNESIYTGVISSMYVDGKYDGYIVMCATADNKTLIIKYDYSGKIVWSDEYSDSEVLCMSLIRNYDNTGKSNGYLLYQNGYSFSNVKDRQNLYNDTFNDYKVKRLIKHADQYKVAKYTYENYSVVKDNDEKGSITTSNDKAYPGEIVRVSVTPKDGYTLKRIVVMTEDGKEIEVSEDGTFIMPEGKVTVVALYNRISNPDTTSACYIVLGIILLISIGTLIVNKKKEA